MANNPMHAMMLASAKNLLAAIEDADCVWEGMSRRWRSYGLCENIKRGAKAYSDGNAPLDAYSYMLDRAFETWPHFSGTHAYPVPDPYGEEEYCADEIYNNTEDMYEGEYGALRIDLLKHCIAKWESEQ